MLTFFLLERPASDAQKPLTSPSSPSSSSYAAPPNSPFGPALRLASPRRISASLSTSSRSLLCTSSGSCVGGASWSTGLYLLPSGGRELACPPEPAAAAAVLARCGRVEELAPTEWTFTGPVLALENAMPLVLLSAFAAALERPAEACAPYAAERAGAAVGEREASPSSMDASPNVLASGFLGGAGFVLARGAKRSAALQASEAMNSKAWKGEERRE